MKPTDKLSRTGWIRFTFWTNTISINVAQGGNIDKGGLYSRPPPPPSKQKAARLDAALIEQLQLGEQLP